MYVILLVKFEVKSAIIESSVNYLLNWQPTKGKNSVNSVDQDFINSKQTMVV